MKEFIMAMFGSQIFKLIWFLQEPATSRNVHFSEKMSYSLQWRETKNGTLLKCHIFSKIDPDFDNIFGEDPDRLQVFWHIFSSP